MNTLTKLVVSNITAAALLGSLAIATRADDAFASALPDVSAQTDVAAAHIAKELDSQLAAAVSTTKPVRLVRQPSVIITEGDDIVSEEVVVIATRLPAVDNRVADAADITVVPVRF
jgi:hypothetical protein